MHHEHYSSTINVVFGGRSWANLSWITANCTFQLVFGKKKERKKNGGREKEKTKTIIRRDHLRPKWLSGWKNGVHACLFEQHSQPPRFQAAREELFAGAEPAAWAGMAQCLWQRPTNQGANGLFTCPHRPPHHRRPITAPSTVTKGGKLNLHRQGKAPSILPRVRLPALSGRAVGTVPVSIRDNYFTPVLLPLWAIRRSACPFHAFVWHCLRTSDNSPLTVCPLAPCHWSQSRSSQRLFALYKIK